MTGSRTITPYPGPRRIDTPTGVATITTPWRGSLEIRLNGGAASRRVLTESHVVIGRIPGVQILLDHHTVSRRHAEMFCDPFGRWWIRDLGSTNGTFVNDEPVIERVLQPGDRVAIGDFTIAFFLEPQDPARTTRGSLTLDDDKPTAIRTLLDFEPPRIAAEHLRTLLEFSRRLIAVESPDERLDALCQLVIREDFHGSIAVVLRLHADGRSELASSTYRPGPIVTTDQPYISRRVLQKVRETREPVLASNLSLKSANSPAVDLTMSRDIMELWVIACPLGMDGGALDVLYVTLPPDAGSVEWLSLFALAAEVYQQSEAAWAARRHAQAHAAIERELLTARQIQEGLVPKKQKLDFTGLDVFVDFQPCKWVGGDYVDALPMPDGRVLFTVGDVCGKGLQAALVTSSLHTIIRASVDVQPSLPALIERVNRHLCDWLPPHSFVTLVALAVDPATGELECVNAGHPPVLIVDRDGDLRALQSAVNPALGVAKVDMISERATLEFGDVLAMYTDGLTELRNANKEMLGQERLGEGFARICAARPGEGSAQIADALRRMLDEFGGDRLPEDDRAFLLAQRR
jgi:serine phosphatase RsbU (regulator of sigma subunit)/pSer/pThr/pTyr-binding forkhead associated (FHA) protein